MLIVYYFLITNKQGDVCWSAYWSHSCSLCRAFYPYKLSVTHIFPTLCQSNLRLYRVWNNIWDWTVKLGIGSSFPPTPNPVTTHGEARLRKWIRRLWLQRVRYLREKKHCHRKQRQLWYERIFTPVSFENLVSIKNVVVTPCNLSLFIPIWM